MRHLTIGLLLIFAAASNVLGQDASKQPESFRSTRDYRSESPSKDQGLFAHLMLPNPLKVTYELSNTDPKTIYMALSGPIQFPSKQKSQNANSSFTVLIPQNGNKQFTVIGDISSQKRVLEIVNRLEVLDRP